VKLASGFMNQAPRVSHSGNAAKILTLTGLALQAAQVGVWFLVGFYFSAEPTLRIISSFLGGIGILWLLLVYVLSYRRMATGDFAGARTPTLVFAVLSVFTVSLLSGLFYVLAYNELDGADPGRNRSQAMLQPTPIQFGSKVCPICTRANPLSTTYCQGCGFALA